MAFLIAGWGPTSAGENPERVRGWSYSSSDTFATIVASGYFNNRSALLQLGDVIYIDASDDNEFVSVTSADAAAVVTVSLIQGDDDALTEGFVFVGNASNVATGVDFATDKQIGVGNGTTFNSVAMTGDITITNAGVTAIGTDKVVSANILADNVTTVKILDANVTTAKILDANVTTAKILDANVTTAKIADVNVTQAKIATNSLTGLVVGNLADAAVIGGIPVVFRIDTAGGATADTDVTVTHKIRVLDVWVVNNSVGTASDTITIKSTANAITDAIDVSGADETVARAGTFDDAFVDIAASGILRVTETDGAGSDSPSTSVYVLAIRVA